MAALLSTGLAPTASADQIDFTGGTVYFNDGSPPAVTNNSADYDGVMKYEESGFRLEFLFATTNPTDFGSHVGDYYNTGNDVIHGHWDSGPFGQVTEIKVSKIDGSTFDLGGFRVSTNTARGGGPSDGNELVWVNSSKASEIFSIPPDNWGLGSGPDPLVTIAPGNTLFQDITYFSFTNGAQSSAVGLGLDNFFLNEPGDPDGTDPTPPIPEPGTFVLIGVGVIGYGVYRRRRKSA